MTDWNVGEQPCKDFCPYELSPFGGVVDHECPTRLGFRAFCANCNRDHHEDGWETCTEEAKQKRLDEYAREKEEEWATAEAERGTAMMRDMENFDAY